MVGARVRRRGPAPGPPARVVGAFDDRDATARAEQVQRGARARTRPAPTTTTWSVRPGTVDGFSSRSRPPGGGDGQLGEPATRPGSATTGASPQRVERRAGERGDALLDGLRRRRARRAASRTAVEPRRRRDPGRRRRRSISATAAVARAGRPVPRPARAAASACPRAGRRPRACRSPPGRRTRRAGRRAAGRRRRCRRRSGGSASTRSGLGAGDRGAEVQRALHGVGRGLVPVDLQRGPGRRVAGGLDEDVEVLAAEHLGAHRLPRGRRARERRPGSAPRRAACRRPRPGRGRRAGWRPRRRSGPGRPCQPAAACRRANATCTVGRPRRVAEASMRSSCTSAHAWISSSARRRAAPRRPAGRPGRRPRRASPTTRTSAGCACRRPARTRAGRRRRRRSAGSMAARGRAPPVEVVGQAGSTRDGQVEVGGVQAGLRRSERWWGSRARPLRRAGGSAPAGRGRTRHRAYRRRSAGTATATRRRSQRTS